MKRNVKIKNVPGGISIFPPLICIIISIVLLLLIFLILVDDSGDFPTFLTFFSWCRYAFKNLMQGSAPYELKIYALIFCYCSAGLLLAATPAFILRKKKIKDLTKGKYLKSIELLDDGVKFNYNKFHFDFSVGFSDIKELKYIIYTCKRNAGLASAICIDNKKICFYLNDGSVIDVYVPFTLSCVELGYTLFNFARNIKKFTYEFSGPGEPPGIREKLDDYKEKGFKPVLSSQEASCYKKASLIFFLIGIALAVFLKIFFPDITVNEPLFVLICISPFLFISFMLDLYFFVDKSIEKFKNGK